ncbi:MAG: hypothetical protein GKS07_01390 [Nitrosopumilus sp.]|nr:MAG: hypothetical protein GKS07_01390 [Nitrosopumilus sp.]
MNNSCFWIRKPLRIKNHPRLSKINITHIRINFGTHKNIKASTITVVASRNGARFPTHCQIAGLW